MPVAGDFVITTKRPAVGTDVAVDGPTAKIIQLSDDNGSIPGVRLSYSNLTPRPLPPRYSLVSSSGIGLRVIVLSLSDT